MHSVTRVCHQRVNAIVLDPMTAMAGSSVESLHQGVVLVSTLNGKLYLVPVECLSLCQACVENLLSSSVSSIDFGQNTWSARWCVAPQIDCSSVQFTSVRCYWCVGALVGGSFSVCRFQLFLARRSMK